MPQLKGWPQAQADGPAAAAGNIGVRIPISVKLGAMLLVPLLTLALIAAFQVQQSRRDAASVREEVRLVQAAMGPNGLATALHFERTAASLTPIGTDDLFEMPYHTNEEARVPVDEALAEFRSVLEKSPRAGEIYRPALERIDAELGDLRAYIDESMEVAETDTALFENRPVVDKAFTQYSDLLDDLLDANEAIADEIDHSALRQGAELAAMAGRQSDAVSHLSRHLLLAGLGPTIGREDVTTAGTNLLTFRVGHNALISLATGEYQALGQKLATDLEEGSNLDGRVSGYIEEGHVDINDLIEATNYVPDESYMGFRDGVEDVIQSQAASMESAATTRFRVYAIAALLTVLVASVITFVVSRSITRPLQSLTGQATRMARHRLPDAVQHILEKPLGENVTVPQISPIDVETRDEVNDVAEALNTVQDSALKLAVEQAVLRRNIADTFVNLGRRNQKLLGRQIDFITDLEQGETNPDNLANLFRLDHLATRMRRNAESLLVLAGIEPPRKWAVPVRLTDVIRAALGEVEDYQRVVLRAVEPVTIVGSAAADVAHLLAELIENALVFSPPDQTVEIRGRTQAGQPSAQPGPRSEAPSPAMGYTIAVIDSGVSMPPEDLDRANRRLAGAESFTIAPSKYLGHYVAGNLAARHNIEVQLLSAAGKGITATVYVPANLIAVDAPPALGVPSHAGGQAPYPEAAGRPAPGIHIPAAVQVPTPPEGEELVYEHTGQPLPREEPEPYSTTISGLPRRVPGSRRSSEPAPEPVGAQPNEALLNTLANVADRVGPITGEVPIGPSGAGTVRRTAATASSLAERVRGAQLPTLQPPLAQRTERQQPAPPEAAVHAPDLSALSGLRRGPARGERRRATRRAPKDVYDFLSNFTTGVQRGLEEAQHAEDPSSGGNGA